MLKLLRGDVAVITKRTYRIVLNLLFTGFLVACSSGGGGSTSETTGATMSISLMDAPVDDVSGIYVEIAGFFIKPQGDGPAIELPMSAPTVTVNLLELTADNAAVLVDNAAISPGSYSWLEMEVNAELDGIMDSYVMTNVGGQEDLEVSVPSGRIRLVETFDVAVNQAVRLLFDWDARQGLINPPGRPGYILKPAFRVLEVTEFGSLSGTVDPLTLEDASCLNDHPSNPTVGNVVYVYQGSDATPVDIDGVDPDPIATANVELNLSSDYVYRILLMPGDYTAAFTCEARNDLPESTETIEFLSPTNVTIDGTGQVLDFEPPP